MLIENTKVYNFEGAFRGMRNPMNSWDKSDSWFGIISPEYDDGSEMEVVDAWIEHENTERKKNGLEDYSPDMEDYNQYYDIIDKYSQWLIAEGTLSYNHNYSDYYDMAFLGPNDLALAQKLIQAGNEHAKFMRQIFVSADLTLPLYIWKEFDTYKIGTVANSTSTMHKLSAAPITRASFEFDKGDNLIVSHGKSIDGEWELVFDDYIEDIIDMCENLRIKFIETGDAKYWRALIQLLPSSYLQKRTVTLSYANLRNIYFQRKNHKLHEWAQICDWIKMLPYAKELITIGE